MGRQAKLGNLRGVSEWEALETTGDVKRFLRWCILSVRDQSLDARSAGVFALMSGYLLKAMEISDFDKRLAELEQRLAQSEQLQGTSPRYEPGSTTTTH